MSEPDTDKGTALITGASSGIGVEIARILAQRGMDLVITARREERLQALRDELTERYQVTVHVIALDLGAPGAAEALIASVTELGKDISVLVNNAGFGMYGKSWDLDRARVKAMLELNITSLTTLTHHYAAQMVARGHGRILQISSIGAYQPSPLYAAYSATKAYVLFLSQAMNWELRGTGVSVSTICPGLTKTEFHEVADHIKPKTMDMMMMSADKVARIGITAMFKGKPVVTPGIMNKLTALMVKLMPRSWVTAVAGRMMSSKRQGT